MEIICYFCNIFRRALQIAFNGFVLSFRPLGDTRFVAQCAT
ncbi:hypothetical protein HMPREF1991_02583 [Hoylesella loescheii DSM 19665 = JCM 12249 = ATCC 15930]|uniref:Uncharacterized protein n=1 Tax=Hoylesella loescheii DSM 19665 = JCM 12249 = ATCC 15930 TaxID=1122985 RepID=A0A069QEP5_HOYLO|nr:hypothetical protein HMPREF1991_02583 [Hoylesella loescheii DSM 19665 = JCM 12249 = ATCC 15930]